MQVATPCTVIQLPLRLMRKVLPDPLQTLAVNTRYILDKMQRSARGVADKIGISNKTVSNMLNAAHSTQIGTADAVAEELGVPLWQLLCPHFPRGPIDESRLARLIEDYMTANPNDREQLERFAALAANANKNQAA